MAQEKSTVAWNLFTEIRKDILEYQKLRTQVIGFKITVVGTGIGLVIANRDKMPDSSLLVPAFAAIFFDFLISSYSFSIKRTGFYCREHIEPIIRRSCDWPTEALLWEEYMCRPTSQRSFALLGNLGITALALAPACYYILILPLPEISGTSALSVSILLIFFFFDAWAYYISRQFDEGRGAQNKRQRRARGGDGKRGPAHPSRP
ncbi:MAG: hypothetical protein M3416_03905 [Acidobacteriota bacterium]|nr:hypothetical protein [Acidobacteriota bacterium]